MALYEWVVVVYFSAFAVVGSTARVPEQRKKSAGAFAVAMVLLAIADFLFPPAIRAWLPHIFLIAGYWLPALLVPRAAEATPFNEWLEEWDAPLRQSLPSVPAALTPVMELAYLSCYPLVPVGFSFVWIDGDVTDVARFWAAVLLAGYSCYATLPWLVSQPPRLLERSASEFPSLLREFNAQVLGKVSHQLNTFPSGHVAVAAAAAAIVATVNPGAGAVLGLVVAAISVGAAVGRYHYAIDVVLGLLVAALAVTVALMQ